MSQWETLHYKAKALESGLERKVQSYSAIAQKINANFLCDEENPLIESNDEQSLASEIERDLSELYDCIQKMRQFNLASLSNQQEVLIKRYYEIHFDFSNEFRNTSATVQRKRESMELMQSSRNLHKDDQESSMAKLARENSTIADSMRNINNLISQAFETKSALQNQCTTLGGSSGTLSNVTSNVPGFGRLIDGIQNKKGKEKLVIAFVIASLTFFLIW